MTSEGKSKAPDSLYEGLIGPALDFERIFQTGTSMGERLRSGEFPEARELLDSVVSMIDVTKFSIEGDAMEIIIRAIRMVAKENQWSSYDDISFDKIRVELEKERVPLRLKRTSKDVE